jgi:hypothetical protein
LVVTGVDGDVSVGTVPVFTSSNPVKIGDSIISVTGSRVVIDGDLSFDSITSGSIDASFIDTGTMLVSRLQKGNPGQVLQTVGTDVKWRNLSDLTIGTSTNSTNSEKVKIKPVSGVDTDYRLVLRLNSGTIGDNSELFSDSGTGGLILRYSTISGLRILAHNGSSANPPYSFDSSSNTGMYRIDGVNSGIGFSVNGNQRVIINNFGLKTILGSVGSPSYTWYGDSTTGMYSPGTNQIGFSIAGQQAVKITSSYINFGLSSTGTPIIKNNSGSVGSPSYTWYGDSDTGMYRPSQDVIGFSTSGTERVRIDNFGRVKIANTDSKNTTVSISKGSNTNTLEVDESVYINDSVVALNNNVQMVKPILTQLHIADYIEIDTTGLSPNQYKPWFGFVQNGYSNPGGSNLSEYFLTENTLEENEEFFILPTTTTLSGPSVTNATLDDVNYDRVITVFARPDRAVFMALVYIYVEIGIGTNQYRRSASLIDSREFFTYTKNGGTSYTPTENRTGTINGCSISTIIPSGCRYLVAFGGAKQNDYNGGYTQVGIKILERKLGSGNNGII